MNNSKKHNSFRRKLHTVIFEADTPSGRSFDITLIVTILLSVLIVMFDSIAEYRAEYGDLFYTLEWMFTILFSIEYLLRLYSVAKPIEYATSFYGVIDLLAVLPTYFSLILPGTQYLLVIRIIRVLRIFRVLKFVQFVAEAQMLGKALRASRKKITVFLFVVFTLVVIFGSLMYLIEGEENGFTNIPQSIYWAIVTLTTVGYGDISPQTGLGRTLASFIMVLGYGIIAVPTGIVTAELAVVKKESTQACPSCSHEGHDEDAEFCKYCGEKL